MSSTQPDLGAALTGQQQTQPQTFAYSQKEVENILVTDSLFVSALNDQTDISLDLSNLSKRRTKTYLHVVTLSDYVRQGVIPRGLRWQKEPMLGNRTAEFCDRWCAILNKCSFDLMTLLVEHLKQDLTAIDAAIERMTVSLRDSIQNETERNQVLKANEENQEKLSKEIREIKIKKFNRDKKDCAEGNVYYWRNPERKSRPRSQRTVHSRGDFHSTLDNLSSDLSTASSSSFLVNKPRAAARRQRGRPPKAAHDAVSRENPQERRSTRSLVRNTRA